MSCSNQSGGRYECRILHNPSDDQAPEDEVRTRLPRHVAVVIAVIAFMTVGHFCGCASFPAK